MNLASAWRKSSLGLDKMSDVGEAIREDGKLSSAEGTASSTNRSDLDS